MSPFGRRVATFVVACLVLDLYGYAVYHAWQTHLIGSAAALVALTVIAGLGLTGLALAPAWLRRVRGEAPVELVSEPPPRPLRWWLPWVLALGSIVAGAGLDAWGRAVLPPARSTSGETVLAIALNAACIGFLSFTLVRLRRPGSIRPRALQFGLALGVIGTIETALRLVGGVSLERIVSVRFAYALVQMAVIYVPLFLWGGYIWGRIMAAIFTPPRR